jgi:hypothetical protein
MGSVLRQPSTDVNRRPPPGRRALFALSTLLFALLLVPALSAPAHTPGSATEAGRLVADLDRISKLVNRELKPPAQHLARSLPAGADDLERLREPALTAKSQVGTALSELRQVGPAAAADPHYLPALVAAGRAYLAVSGQDPLTGTTVNPEYRGLEPELTESAAQLDSSATEATALSSRVKRLTRSLAGAKRRARKLKREIRRLRAADAGPARR